MTRFLVTTSIVVVSLLVGLAACLSSLGDQFLGASGNQRVVAPGEPITGRVHNPDGDIYVTLAATDTPPPPDGSHSPGARDCAYKRGNYSCATDGLIQGNYRVEVTDPDKPNEGIHFVEVVVTNISNYNPKLSLSDDKNSVVLEGWAPGRDVTLTVIDRNLDAVVAGPVSGTPDRNGDLVLPIGNVRAGTYAFEATDGLWAPGDINNGWDQIFLTI